MNRTILRRLGALVLLAVTLASCAIDGGVPEATIAPPPAPAAPLPQATDTSAATAIAERGDTWQIGLLEAPRDLYPYQPGPAQQRIAAPILELLYPSPILAFNYGYTTTGVLERIPTLENGGAERRKADVFLDAAGQITTTTTQVITQVDQLVVTYRWNPKLSWSDGTPLTADDSVFAYELARAAPPNDEARDRLAQTLRYERVDDHTTRAVLKPDLIGPNYFMNVWTPLPRHLLQGVAPETLRDSPFARAPIGYGPYAIVSRTSGEIRMERNPHYFGPAPAASRLTVAFFPGLDLARASILNGNLDAAATDRPDPELFPRLDQDAKSKLALVSYLRNPIWEHIDFNLDVKVLQDIRVRRAIALGTNRKAMSKAIFGGRAGALDSWVLPQEQEAAPRDKLTRYGYDPDGAKKLLDEAGLLVRDDGIRGTDDGFTMTLQLLTTANTPVRSAIAKRFKDDMRAIGINIEIQEIPTEQLFDPSGPLYQRQFELALFGWGAGPEPGGLTLWSCAAVPSDRNGWTGENFSGWCFRDADRAIRRAVTELDPVARREAYIRQQELWSQELPSMALFQRLSLTLVGPRIQGALPDPFAPITWNIASWRRGT